MDYADAEPQSPISFQMKPLGRVDPLLPEFGNATKHDLPEPLAPYLFEDSEKGAAYVVLDGTHMRGGLEELLDSSGLEFACLLSGSTKEELAQTAPWIVRIEQGNSFVRSLFSHDPKKDIPWHYWRHAPGLFVRSTAGLEEMRQHFRKFLRIKDSEERSFYFRFWECGPLLEYLLRAEPRAEVARMWLRTATRTPLELILPISGYCYHCSATGEEQRGAPRGSLNLTEADQAAIYDGTLRAKASRILYRMECYNSNVFEDRDREALITQAVSTIKRLIGYRVTSGIDVARAVRLEVLLRAPLEAWDKTGTIIEILKSDLRESRKMDLVEAHVDSVFAQPVQA